ncbi:FecR family protein [Flavihumibacter sp. RY-1]|uniref:FecR family protein n=1 Tax=Flavihumibacter fluminis TaxID=2909236 RepID=A0ABS9BDB8_9BACT|nr:FecR family protein [Flavihumibacter fluminis]MCF1713699.1 FecR family protein [Flavihumibacter fluminis]
MTEKEINQLASLVFDPSFRAWLMGKEEADNVRWEQWLNEAPGHKDLVDWAKALVYSLAVDHHTLSEEELDLQVRNLLQRASRNKGMLYVVGKEQKRFSQFRVGWIMAAAAMFVLFIGLYFFINRVHVNPGELAGERDHVGVRASSVVMEQVNDSDTVHQFYLADGSLVKLYPGSRLQYRQNSIEQKREVFLTGQAFFEVKKNAQRPFYVNTRNIVTVVLGTSFYVKAFDKDTKSVVSVVSGKVSVFKTPDRKKPAANSGKLQGTILTPNQQVEFDVQSNELKKMVVQSPCILPQANNLSFEFSGTRIKEVFQKLESAYGVQIVYDEEVLAGCTLSASLGNEAFFDKLKIICMAINASYEVMDGSVVISSTGCKN